MSPQASPEQSHVTELALVQQGAAPAVRAIKFEDSLDVSPLDDGKNWTVLEDFYYDSDVDCDGCPPPFGAHGSRILVEKGFTTDFASIPRPLWAIIGAPADGKYRKIAVVHDKLYRTRGLATKAEADSVLLEGMEFCGVGWLSRHLIYAGVRVGGSSSYKGGL